MSSSTTFLEGHCALALVSAGLRGYEPNRIKQSNQDLRAAIIFANLKPGQTKILSACRSTWGHIHSLFGYKQYVR